MKIKTTGQKTSLLVAMLTLSIASAMFYSFYVGRNIAFHYAHLLDAAMEIKLEATTAHLWLEEIISGDRMVEIEAVWEHIDQAEWYARAMLDGGENKQAKFISLDDADLRRQIEQTIAGIKAFRIIAHERWEARSRSGIGSDIDQYSDETFLAFVIAVDNVETALKKATDRHLQQYSIEQTLLIIIIIVLGVFTGIILFRYDRRRSTDMQRLHDKEQNLRSTLNSIGDAVIVTDANGSITHLNPVAENLTGWTLEQALSKPLLEVFNIVHAHSMKPVVNPVEQVIKTAEMTGAGVDIKSGIQTLFGTEIQCGRCHVFHFHSFEGLRGKEMA